MAVRQAGRPSWNGRKTQARLTMCVLFDKDDDGGAKIGLGKDARTHKAKGFDSECERLESHRSTQNLINQVNSTVNGATSKVLQGAFFPALDSRV